MRDRKRRKRKEEKGRDSQLWWGNWRKVEVNASRKTCSLLAKYNEIEEGLSEESAVASLWQARQSKTCTDHLYHSLVLSSLRWVLECGQGLELGTNECGMKSIPRERTAATCMETALRDRSEEFHSWKCPWKFLRLPWKWGTLLNDTQGTVLPSKPLSSHTNYCLHWHWDGLPHQRACILQL